MVLCLAACTAPAMIGAHGQDIEQAAGDRARCKLFANGATPDIPASGFYARGSQQYVAAASAGFAVGQLAMAIGHAVEKRANFVDCMVASGYRLPPQ
jgi:hypothetical protein